VTDTSLVEVDPLESVRRLVAAAPELRPIGLREVVSGAGAIGSLAALLSRLGVAADARGALLTDDVPKPYGDGEVLDAVWSALSDVQAQAVVLAGAGTGGVHADERTVSDAVVAVAASAPRFLVTVGSGTVADIGKVVAQRLDLPHVVVQTAASVNGYADDQSVLLLNGTKRTTPSRWPDALVIDSRALAGSPVAMTRSGLGDLLSTYTACADWQLARIVGFDDSYSETAVTILRSGVDAVVAAVDGLAVNEASAVSTLAAALTHGGLAMGAAGRTSPSSGAEHTVSHLLEMQAAAVGRPAAAHGAQVGAATVVMARLWARMRERLRAGVLTVRPLDEEQLRRRVDDAFRSLDPTGATVEECWKAYSRKLSWINEHLEQIRTVCETWDRYDEGVAALLAGPETVAALLRRAGAPERLTDLDPSPGGGIARWAVASCHLMRDRFTVVDLAEVTGCWTESDVDAVLA
jgi:glycerol-1-phosphate dehydrogenase [NAD(P)+]